MSVYLRMNHKKKFSGFTDFNPPQQTKGRKRTPEAVMDQTHVVQKGTKDK